MRYGGSHVALGQAAGNIDGEHVGVRQPTRASRDGDPTSGHGQYYQESDAASARQLLGKSNATSATFSL